VWVADKVVDDRSEFAIEPGHTEQARISKHC
jgi:hypothetical protein